MNFLRIGDVPDTRTGGMARFMHYISDELRAAGHTVDLLFREDIGLRVPARLRRFAVPVRVVQLVRRLVRQGKRYNAVEIHEPIAAAYGVARKFDPSLPPMVVVSYGLEHRCHLAMLAYYRKKQIPLSFQRRCGHYSVIWQANAGLRLADQVTVENSEDEAFLSRTLGVPADRVTIVNGGLTPVFMHAPPPDPTARGILFLATWIERKGILDLIPALTGVLNQHPDLPITIAGFGAPADVVAGAFPAPVRERLRLMPVLTNEQSLLDLYRCHAVFLAPSVFEGQLLTMLEAAAAGLAVVATNTCGMRDFIRHGENGLLFETGDPEALARHISQLIEDSSFATRLGLAARQDAQRFTWKRSAGQFLTAAESAVARSRRRRTAACAV
ncbi:MAG TPA: glycosyltransferase family 4 protein [Gemmataceae bacterium]|nr:glycosyltransferase family 4 protein [Gemmataceae bacterium]